MSIFSPELTQITSNPSRKENLNNKNDLQVRAPIVYSLQLNY